MSSSKSFLHSLRYRLINLYPPFLGAGIRVLHRQSDDYTIKVQMKLTRLNLNAVGTHFGGSLYAMCDPFFMLLLLEHLGRDYVVWDKAASIQFLKPGRAFGGHVPFRRRHTELRAQTDQEGKIEPLFNVDVIDEQGEVVAQVEKRLYLRRKKQSAL
jgi:acyl-coenzyme A thioesterase PaaI-like protein